jgi:hypothetical protein
MREIGERDRSGSDLTLDFPNFLMRECQKALEQAELCHHLECRGMNGVAAKVAQKIAMLLQHKGIYAGTREQQPEHDARRTATSDAALGLSDVHVHDRRALAGNLRRGR